MQSDHGIGLGSAFNFLVLQVVRDVGEGEVVRQDLPVRLLARGNQGISFFSKCLLSLISPLDFGLKLFFSSYKYTLK